MPPLKIAIIGAGPGGYVAAFHAADLGMEVTLIDRSVDPGGVCLYFGCIPSKALLHAAKVVTDAASARALGIGFIAPDINVEQLRSWKDSVVTKLTSGLGQLTKQRKIKYIQGEATFLNSATIEVEKIAGGVEKITFDKAIIATGSRPVTLPFLPASSRIWDSTKALGLPTIPKNLLVIGGGYIGLELGNVYANLGSKVSLVEMLPTLLPGPDRDLADILARKIKTKFTQVMTSTKVIRATEKGDGIEVVFQDEKGAESTENFENVLVAVGRKPNTDGLGLEKIRIKVNGKGFIEVNGQRQTSHENIFAIGDVTGNPMLAHKASAEAKVVAEAIAGKKSVFEPLAMPAVVFTDPELAWCGLTEAEARSQGHEIIVSKFPWAASGRALTLNRTDGLTKIIADATTKRVLGVGIVGVGAGDLISEGALAIEMGAVADDLSRTIHPHPTKSETLKETAEGLFGSPTHILRPKK
jgi:dihydrolipoamide dehydrogenase